MKGLVEEHEAGSLVQSIEVATGSIYEEILNAAETKGANLIVIAGRERRRLDRFMTGSNAEKIVRYVHCSVLVVK